MWREWIQMQARGMKENVQCIKGDKVYSESKQGQTQKSNAKGNPKHSEREHGKGLKQENPKDK